VLIVILKTTATRPVIKPRKPDAIKDYAQASLSIFPTKVDWLLKSSCLIDNKIYTHQNPEKFNTKSC